MSRIDRALKVWEADNGLNAAEPEIAPSSSLNQYAHEEVIPQHPQPEPARLRSSESSQSSRPSSISRPSEDRKRFADHADIEARLVTGDSSNTSLEQYRRLAAAL